VAQTRRKRRTKHRGNAAGVVEARGRTTKPLDPKDRKRGDREKARERRLNQPPSWKRSARNAAFASISLFVLILVIGTGPKHGSKVPSAVVLALVALVLYVPGGYYLEMGMYRRRLAKQARAQRK
jgi:Flp pilus assembly protein TadB